MLNKNIDFSFFNYRFDEMHYGKYASLYLKNTFFFDANPPLGKLMIAFAGYMSGFDGGTFGFDKIGTSYPEDVPHFVLRLVPAMFGSLLTPTVFLILTEFTGQKLWVSYEWQNIWLLPFFIKHPQ